jgi:hypothetical protein
VGTFRRRDLVSSDIFQGEHDMDAPDHQHALLDLYFAVRDGFESIPARHDLARLQRAAQGTEQSTTGRGDDIVDRGRVRIRHFSLDAVVTGNRPMGAKANGFWLSRQLRETERALDPRQRNLGSVDNFSHWCLSK